jgi:hypothetical protein
MIANANMQRFLGLVLLISLVVGIYLTLQEIDRAMGKEALLRLLCERPVGQNDDLVPNQRLLAKMQQTGKEIKQEPANYT